MVYKMLYIILHINKTAGTSLRHVVEMNYPDSEKLFVYPGAQPVSSCWVDNIDNLKHIPEAKLARLKVMMGHVVFGIHEMFPLAAKYITVLRDPVDRVLSTYYHHRTKPGSPLFERFNEPGFDIDAFLDMGLSAIDNRMTRVVSGREIPPFSVQDSDLEIAINNLHQHFALVLLTEHYQEGLQLLAERLNWQATSSAVLNRSEGRRLRSDHPDHSLQRIAELNRYDIKLYEYVKENFAQLNGVGD